jgi:hypothetical protein
VAVGLDANANGQLDDAEVTARSELCNGSAGTSGLAALAAVDTVAAGSGCTQGGLRVRAGLDSNRDGLLADAEATSSALVCSGSAASAGRPQLFSLAPVAELAANSGCSSNAGTRIASGVDLNADGLLSAAETTTTQTLCSGSTGSTGAAARLPLLALTAEAAGAACAAGGQRIATGLDTNGNGTLDSAEQGASSLVCRGGSGAAGAPGAAGANSLLAVAAEPAGTRCASGGTRLDAGVDRNASGTLDAAEITSSRYLCQANAGPVGSPAAPALLAVRAEPAGTACAQGGRRLDTGPDSNGNGQLDSGEVSSSGFVCDGAAGGNGSDGQNGLVRVAAAGSACSSGGQAVASGLDANRNGVLDDAEVASVELVCNGSAGAAGSTGAAGLNGLVLTSTLAPGAPCATGGQSVRRGVDSNRNGVLDNAEVTGTTVACNGTDSVGFVWTASAGSTLNAAANQGYITTRADGEATVTLPAAPTVGAFYRVSGSGAGGWVLAQRAGQHIELGGGEDLVRRSDLYADWRNLGNVQLWQGLAGSAGLGVLLGAVRNGTLQLSVDQGASWVARGGTAIWQAAAASATGRRLAAVVAGGQIHTSGDFGATFTARNINRNWSAIASSGDGLHLLAAVRNGQLHTSSDGGVNWTPRENTRAWAAVASSRDGQRLLAADNGGRLYTSGDGGATWTAREGERTWTAVASSASGDRLLAADYGGTLYLSSDGGASWQPRGPALGWAAVAASADGGRLMASADNGAVFASDDGGSTWTQRTVSAASTALVLSADGADAVQALNGGSVRRSLAARGVLGTRSGSAGTLRGGQGSAAELQYLGSGVFLLRSREGTLFAD